MKKLFFLSVVVFFTLTANAQYWEHHSTEGDELTGDAPRSFILAVIPNKGTVTIDDNDNTLYIQTNEGIFNFKNNSVDGLFGLYDEEGKLIIKEEIRLFVTYEMPKMAVGMEEYARARAKIATWIRNQKGSVRIVIPRFGDSSFDVKIPTIPSQKLPSQTTNKPTTNRKLATAKKPIR